MRIAPWGWGGSRLDRVRSDGARPYPSGSGPVNHFLPGHVVWGGVVVSECTCICTCMAIARKGHLLVAGGRGSSVWPRGNVRQQSDSLNSRINSHATRKPHSQVACPACALPFLACWPLRPALSSSPRPRSSAPPRPPPPSLPRYVPSAHVPCTLSLSSRSERGRWEKSLDPSICRRTYLPFIASSNVVAGRCVCMDIVVCHALPIPLSWSCPLFYFQYAFFRLTIISLGYPIPCA